MGLEEQRQYITSAVRNVFSLRVKTEVTNLDRADLSGQINQVPISWSRSSMSRYVPDIFGLEAGRQYTTSAVRSVLLRVK